MDQRRLRVVASGLAVHERRRSERRRAHEPGAEEVRDPAPLDPVRPAEGHQQIVRMLIVDERRAPVRLAGLKHLRRPERLHRERLERQHRHRQRARASGLAAQHEPVLRNHTPKIGDLPVLSVWRRR
jgi:hypothetical protein